MLYYLRLLKKTWWVFLIAVSVSVLSYIIYANKFIVPIYDSTAKIIITQDAQVLTDDPKLAAQARIEPVLYSYLVKESVSILQNRELAEEVRSELVKTIPEMKKYDFSKYLKVTSVVDTRIIDITAGYPGKSKYAPVIANTFASVFKKKMAKDLGFDVVKSIDKAVLPQSPTSPKPIKDSGMVGGGVLLMVLVVILFVDYIMKEIENEKKALKSTLK